MVITKSRDARSRAMSLKLGARILALCEEHGLSQRQLALHAELDPSYVSRIIRGLTEPGLATIGAIGEVFGLTPSQFLDGVTW